MASSTWSRFAVLAFVVVACLGCPPTTPEAADGNVGPCVAFDAGPAAPDPDATIDSNAVDSAHDSSIDSRDANDADADETDDADADADLDAVPIDSTIVDTAPDTAPPPDTTPADTTPAPPFDAGPKVSFAEVEDIVKVSCAFDSCHGRRPVGVGTLFMLPGVNDWSSNLIGVTSHENPTMMRVKPGDPGHSWIVHKLAGDNCLYTSVCLKKDCGDRMPQANEPIDPRDLDVIIRWIRQGAVKK